MRIDDNWCESALAVLEGVNVNGLITKLGTNYSYEVCKNYQFVASATTGTDHIDNRDVPLLCLKGAPGLKEVYATAEHTFALILSLIRKVPFAFDDVKQGNWNRDAWQGSELYGKMLGIVGYGRVGQQVAKIAEAFGMRWIAMDKYPYGWKDFLGDSDIVTLHVPLDDSTKGMFNHELFSLMKPLAYFINTSRGAVVKEKDLIDALDSGQIRGAAIDVACYEPCILIDLYRYINRNNNLIITPHIAGNTAESREKTQLLLASKIVRHINSIKDGDVCRG